MRCVGNNCNPQSMNARHRLCNVANQLCNFCKWRNKHDRDPTCEQKNWEIIIPLEINDKFN